MELLTVKDVAAEIGRSKSTVLRLVRKGLLQPALPVRERQHLVFHRAALDAYLARKQEDKKK
jgi:excisionase family DNA binding protein